MNRNSIAAPTGIVAIYTVRDDNLVTTRYLTTDHLGSSSEVTNEVGVVTEAMSYDAFGAKRDPATWQTYAFGSVPVSNDITDQGYTGQQDLDPLGLIHMNGRVQDPYTGRFVSADPTVPDPGYSQAFNRFAYVYNNPMNSVDPSGYDPCPKNDPHGFVNCENLPGTSEVPLCSSSVNCLPASTNQNTAPPGPQPSQITANLGKIEVTATRPPQSVPTSDMVFPSRCASNSCTANGIASSGYGSTSTVYGSGKMCISGLCGNGVQATMDTTDGATTWDGTISGDSGGESLVHIARNTQAPQLPGLAGGGGPTVGSNRNGPGSPSPLPALPGTVQ